MRKQLKINGETVAVSQQEPLLIELFLNDNYRFRRNVLNGKVELLTLPEGEDAQWRPLTQEALNSIILRAERENILEKGSPSAQIKMYVQSEEVPVFNPVAAFIDYEQFYAQVLYELREVNAPFWFNNLEVQRIQQLNQNYMEEKDIAEILNACIRKPEEGEVAQAMDCKQLLELVQKEYPLVANTRSTKIHIGLAMKEFGYELTKRGNRPYYKVVPLTKAA